MTTPGSAALDPAPEAVVLTFDRSAVRSRALPLRLEALRTPPLRTG